MTLISSLKSQHASLRQSMQAIDEALVSGDGGRVASALEAFTNELGPHLRLEDDELYPGLLKAAREKKDESVERTAQIFSTNMARISDSLRTFLDRYAKSTFDLKAFERDWRSISIVLNQRLVSEETALYPMYVRVTKP